MTPTTRARVRCRTCGGVWAADKKTCPRCLAALPQADEPTRTCRHCGRVWPAPMEMCPVCLAELHPDPAAAVEAAMINGRPAYRTSGAPTFVSADGVTLRRLTAEGALVYLAADVMIEAHVTAHGRGWVCVDIEGPVLFDLQQHGAVWLATDRDGDPLAAFELRPDLDFAIDVRDDASAPCARLRPRGGDNGYDLVETGGGPLGACDRDDRELPGGWVDDAWTLSLLTDDLPMSTLGLVALPLAAKLLLGRVEPARLGGWANPEPQSSTDSIPTT